MIGLQNLDFMNTGTELRQYFCANTQFKTILKIQWGLKPPNLTSVCASGFHLVQSTTRDLGRNWGKMCTSLWCMPFTLAFVKIQKLSQKFKLDIDIIDEINSA